MIDWRIFGRESSKSPFTNTGGLFSFRFGCTCGRCSCLRFFGGLPASSCDNEENTLFARIFLEGFPAPPFVVHFDTFPATELGTEPPMTGPEENNINVTKRRRKHRERTRRKSRPYALLSQSGIMFFSGSCYDNEQIQGTI